jgi:hypothetical protein
MTCIITQEEFVRLAAMFGRHNIPLEELKLFQPTEPPKDGGGFTPAQKTALTAFLAGKRRR